MSILYRIPEKIKKRLRIKTLPTEQLQEDPFLDWSIRVISPRFVHDSKFEYILLINGVSRYVTLFKNPGFNSMEELARLAAQSIRAQFLFFALRDLYNKRIAPHIQDFRIARASDARTTAFGTAIAREAEHMLKSNESIEDICFKLNNSFARCVMLTDGSFYTPDQSLIKLFKS